MDADRRSLQAIVDALAGALPGGDDPPLALVLLHELARAQPVATSVIAAAGRAEAA